jgi:hypothetical protein
MLRRGCLAKAPRHAAVRPGEVVKVVKHVEVMMTSRTFLRWLESCTMVLQMLSVSQMVLLWDTQFDTSRAWEKAEDGGGLFSKTVP